MSLLGSSLKTRDLTSFFLNETVSCYESCTTSANVKEDVTDDKRIGGIVGALQPIGVFLSSSSKSAASAVAKLSFNGKLRRRTPFDDDFSVFIWRCCLARERKRGPSGSASCEYQGAAELRLKTPPVYYTTTHVCREEYTERAHLLYAILHSPHTHRRSLLLLWPFSSLFKSIAH